MNQYRQQFEMTCKNLDELHDANAYSRWLEARLRESEIDDKRHRFYNAQEIAKNPLIIDLRKVKWPNDATNIWIAFTHEELADLMGDKRTFLVVERPVQAWLPRAGDWVWWVTPSGNQAAQWTEDSEMPTSGRFALAIDMNVEKDWTWEQFVARGQCKEFSDED